ncbi:MAG: AAA family ATPase [Actinomycetota bacterium]
MTDEHRSAIAPLLEGSEILTRGRADVFRQRERTRRRKLVRALVVIAAVDAWLWYRLATNNPIQLPSLPDDWIIFLPALLLIAAIGLMVAMPLMSGRSPHITVHPEQVEIGLTDIRGLDGQVDEVARTLDVFLGYATFRDELGGTPRRGVLFEGPPGTGKTYLAKAMAKQAGVPFLFISAPAFQSMWFGMTGSKIRSYFKALRKAARKEGGAIGFIEEIDAIGMSRDALGMSPAPSGPTASPSAGALAAPPAADGLGRVVSPMISGGNGGMVNELLIQMQSFDQPPWRTRVKSRMVTWVNSYLPPARQFAAAKPTYNNILLIAATNRADALDPALLRPGRFDRRLYFDVPTKQGRQDLIDFFMDRKAHEPELDLPSERERLAHDTFGYTPVMLEHLFDEALLVALRDGRR